MSWKLACFFIVLFGYVIGTSGFNIKVSQSVLGTHLRWGLDPLVVDLDEPLRADQLPVLSELLVIDERTLNNPTPNSKDIVSALGGFLSSEFGEEEEDEQTVRWISEVRATIEQQSGETTHASIFH